MKPPRAPRRHASSGAPERPAPPARRTRQSPARVTPLALDVNRATVFRWVGTRELLYGEVISSLFEVALSTARKQALGEGPELLADITQRLFHLLVTDAPLRTFVQQDAEYAMRILMSRSSTVEQRCAASIRAALEDGVRAGLIRPVMDLDALTGDPVDVESAITAIRILLTVEKEDARWKRR